MKWRFWSKKKIDPYYFYALNKKDGSSSMGALVIDCSNCHRLLMLNIHTRTGLDDFHKHGRMCLVCILRIKYSHDNLEMYIQEAELCAKMFYHI